MKGIFINYRRGGTASHAAGRMEKYLSDHFGSNSVFLDVQDISPGREFGKTIDRALSQCHSFIPVIDQHWCDAEQVQRLHDPNDFVRREIAGALERDARIFPVLLDGTGIPSQQVLPGCLKSLTRYQALVLNHETFEENIQALIGEIKTHLNELDLEETKMQCPNCQMPVAVSPYRTMTNCRACNTEIGVLRVVPSRSYPSRTKEGDQREPQLSRSLDLAELDVKRENYLSAYNQYCDILTAYPDSWEAMINKAICLFWIGSEDLEHLPEVFTLLDKADLLSNHHPRVHVIRKNLAYNLVIIAAGEDMVGGGIQWSLRLFGFSRSMMPDDDKRDLLIRSYIHKCYQGVRQRLADFLARDKKDFDPPAAEIDTLYQLIGFDTSSEIMRFFILMAERKVRIHSDLDQLAARLEKIRGKYRDLHPEVPLLKIKFPFFGPPAIKGM